MPQRISAEKRDDKAGDPGHPTSTLHKFNTLRLPAAAAAGKEPLHESARLTGITPQILVISTGHIKQHFFPTEACDKDVPIGPSWI